MGSPGYHLLLAAVAIFILGPLGGISAAFMNFSIGFFIGGQVLAGILGSAVTLPYGPEGKHGANYIQTMAASVAGMCGLGVLIQAMVWLGLPEPAWWKLVLFYLCIGMYGVGLGMLYTPILVDKMQLTYPSGFAVANILRALTDKNLLKRSIAKLGGGIFAGYSVGWFGLKYEVLGFSKTVTTLIGGWNISISTFGAGAICGARIAIPALVVGLIGIWQTPHLVEMGWLEKGQPFRKIGFIISLGTILGAAIVDILLIMIQAVKRYREKSGAAAPPAEDWKRVNMRNLVLWILFWGAGTVMVGSNVMKQPVLFLVVAVLLCFLFVLVNGISLGISDWNPISSAFVVTVFILSAIGLKDPTVGLMCASIVLIACSEGGDMQQDRSTGWRLGTNRLVQFRYQVIGITMGALLAVALAKVFMNAYPVLKIDQFGHKVPGAEQWQSTMTFKFVGALKGITEAKPYVMKAMWMGIGLGVIIEVLRKSIKASARYKEFAKNSRRGKVTDFTLDAVLLSSPYASSFGGFVEMPTIWWWTAGGVAGSLYGALEEKLRAARAKPGDAELPADMSTVSLVGGGLIAGESLAALTVGIYGLIASGALQKLFGG
ncbi:MAG: peptide transporter [Pedosphaera sp.]|nr:peptide transporter [Pedosphaera sp.]